MNDRYESPLSLRYSSDEMQEVFSPRRKFTVWRSLWIALARAQKELGLPITDKQISEMEEFKDEINFEVAAAREKEVRHDVMAHIFAFGEQAKSAKPIIHLGATSMYVVDNTDIILMRDGLLILKKKIINILSRLSEFAEKYKALPMLGFTHYQPAQLVTLGKRTTLWMNELLLDLDELEFRLSNLKLLGSKGTTGTQASFLELFDGDFSKVKKLEGFIAREMGFSDVYPVSGQTYSRKVDYNVLSTLSGIAQSAYKFSGDLRLLANLKEVEEPFETNQIGSSAMPYKRNPMRSERMAALSRFVIINSLNPAMTSAVQWFERTLDDSANKRLSVPEAFLAADAILEIYLNITSGLVVYEKVIEKRIMEELPFMATENIMMAAVKKGGDRQELHEKIRTLSMQASKRIKEEGLSNNLLDLICADPAFKLNKPEIEAILKPENFTGCAKEQTEEFLSEIIAPILKKYEKLLGLNADLHV